MTPRQRILKAMATDPLVPTAEAAKPCQHPASVAIQLPGDQQEALLAYHEWLAMHRSLARLASVSLVQASEAGYCLIVCPDCPPS